MALVPIEASIQNIVDRHNGIIGGLINPKVTPRS